MPSPSNKFWLFIVLIGIDQLLKWFWPVSSLNQFSWWSESSGVLIIVLFSMVFLILTSRRLLLSWSTTILFAGIVSNLLDQILHSGIKDIWPLFSYHTNLADILITGGAILAVKDLIWPPVWSKQQKPGRLL